MHLYNMKKVFKLRELAKKRDTELKIEQVQAEQHLLSYYTEQVKKDLDIAISQLEENIKIYGSAAEVQLIKYAWSYDTNIMTKILLKLLDKEGFPINIIKTKYGSTPVLALYDIKQP